VVVLGDVVLGEVVDEPLEEPLMPEPVLVPPLELELEPLLKCASHSVREIWPSLFVSTDEKLGWLLLPELVLGDVVLDELPPADGEADDGLDDEEEESAAAAASDRAKSAAAVVTVTVLIMGGPLWLRKPPTPRKCRAGISSAREVFPDARARRVARPLLRLPARSRVLSRTFRKRSVPTIAS
jgi:hypothetical protein